jgi:hypothetical protein
MPRPIALTVRRNVDPAVRGRLMTLVAVLRADTRERLLLAL